MVLLISHEEFHQLQTRCGALEITTTIANKELDFNGFLLQSLPKNMSNCKVHQSLHFLILMNLHTTPRALPCCKSNRLYVKLMKMVVVMMIMMMMMMMSTL